MIRRIIFLAVFSAMASAQIDLYLTNETHILRRFDAKVNVIYYHPKQAVVSLAVDISSEILFWSDISDARRGIYRSKLDGNGARRIVERDVMEVNGISIDWSSNLLYWTDAQKQRIEVCDYEGKYRRTIVNSDLIVPRGIVADPMNGYLYWNDQNRHVIERSRPDGSERTIFLSEGVVLPNEMAIDWDGNRLLWVDAGSKTLNDISLDSSESSILAQLGGASKGNPVFGLAMYGRNIYVSAWGPNSLLRIASNDVNIAAVGLSTTVMFGIASTDRKFQMPGSNPCSQPTRASCAQICLPTGATTARCACPSLGDRVLANDGKSCTVPNNFVLVALPQFGEVALSSFDAAGLTPLEHRSVVGQSRRPVAVAYDPTKQMVYWSDVRDRSIYRSFLSGSAPETLLNASDSLGLVEGLSLDWRNRKLYFSNADSVTIDRQVVNWHKIEVIDVDTLQRKMLSLLPEKPRAVYVDSKFGYLYFTDWGKNAALWRANLDGSEPIIIRYGLSNPNGVTMVDDKLYVVDSMAKTRESDSATGRVGGLFRSNNIGEEWVELKNIDLQTPYAVTSTGNSLLITDWGRRSIIHFNLLTNQSTTAVSDISEPMGIYFGKRVEQTVDRDCTRAGCSDLCFPGRVSNKSICACPTSGLKVLSSNGKTCITPKNFVMASDLDSLRWSALGSGDTEVYSALSGPLFGSSFTGIVWDNTYQQFYAADVVSGQIYKGSLLDKPSLMMKVEQNIEMLAINGRTRHLFATAPASKQILKINLNKEPLTTEVIVNTTGTPRAIAVDQNEGYLFWTETSPQAVVIRAFQNGSGKGQVAIDAGGLTQPNGLHIDEDKRILYVLNGRQVFNCTITRCGSSFVLPKASDTTFGLLVHDNSVYYSDWGKRTISRHNVIANHTTEVKTGFTRPGQFVFVHPGSILDNCRNILTCSEKCLPVYGGFQCKCKAGQIPTEDGQSCISDGSSSQNPNYVTVTSSISLVSKLTTERVTTAGGDTMQDSVTVTTSITHDLPILKPVTRPPVVEGGPPPRFTFCPSDIHAQTPDQTVKVWWPDPRAVTSSGVTEVEMQSNYPNGFPFNIGEVRVSYSTTGSNKATCSFKVIVLRQPFGCKPTPVPINGNLSCSRNDRMVTSCQAACAKGYVLHPNLQQIHSCRSVGWSPPFPEGFSVLACLRRENLFFTSNLVLSFTGSCQDSPNFRSRFKSDLIKQLQQKGACTTEINGVCDASQISLSCSTSNQNRRKRQANQVSVVVKSSQPNNETTGEEFQSNVNNVKSLIQSGSNFLTVTVDGQTYSLTSADVQSNRARCPNGMMEVVSARCGICPAGAFHNTSSGICEACPAGTYQPLESQISCTPCSTTLSSTPGSLTVNQCALPIAVQPISPTTVPSSGSGDWSVPLIVGICILGGIVLLIALIVACVTVRRVLKHKYTGKMNVDHEKMFHNNNKGMTYYSPAFVARPQEEQVKNDSIPRYIAISRNPPSPGATAVAKPSDVSISQTSPIRLHKLPSGQVVKVMPVKVRVPKSKAKSRKYQMTELSSTAVADRGEQMAEESAGMYRKYGTGRGWQSLTLEDKTTI